MQKEMEKEVAKHKEMIVDSFNEIIVISKNICDQKGLLSKDEGYLTIVNHSTAALTLCVILGKVEFKECVIKATENSCSLENVGYKKIDTIKYENGGIGCYDKNNKRLSIQNDLDIQESGFLLFYANVISGFFQGAEATEVADKLSALFKNHWLKQEEIKKVETAEEGHNNLLALWEKKSDYKKITENSKEDKIYIQEQFCDYCDGKFKGDTEELFLIYFRTVKRMLHKITTLEDGIPVGFNNLFFAKNGERLLVVGNFNSNFNSLSISGGFTAGLFANDALMKLAPNVEYNKSKCILLTDIIKYANGEILGKLEDGYFKSKIGVFIEHAGNVIKDYKKDTVSIPPIFKVTIADIWN